MDLRSKIALGVILVVALSTLIYCLTFRAIFLKSFDDLESRQAELSIKRCISALAMNINHLDRTVNDWASWDDTYTFTETLNQNYIESNLTPESFKYLRIDYLSIFDKNGKFLWGKCFNPETGREIPVNLFKLNAGFLDRLIKRDGSLAPQHGILSTKYGPMIIASRPILTTRNKGPSHGTLLMGRLLSSHLQEEIALQAGINVKIWSVAGDGIPERITSLANNFSTGGTIKLLKASPDILKAYAPIRGLDEKVVILLEASLPRDLKDITRNLHVFGLIFIIGMGFAVILAIKFMLQVLFLKPVTNLTENVLSIKESHRDTKGFDINRKDEIGTLSQAYASMIQRLTRSEQHYRFLAENAQDVIWTINLDKVYTYISPSVTKLSGYCVEEVIGWKIERALTPESLGIALSHLNRVLSLEKENPSCVNDWSYPLELEVIRKDGSTVWTEMTFSLMRDSGGAISGIMGITRDISERIKAEEEKKRIQEQFIQSQKMEALGGFAGGIAHDLNNILCPIIINIEELLDEEQEGSDRHEILDQTLKAAHRQKDLVKKILFFSRRSERILQPLGIKSILEETINFLRSSLPSTIRIQQNICVQNDVVMGDPVQIQQVIMNLCKNAADAYVTGKGTIEVGLINTHTTPMHSHQDVRADEYLKITVIDTGQGMKPEVMDRIFEPFFTNKGVGKGTGLGLSVVHGIVKSHGGIITVESQEGKGSIFAVYLPASRTKLYAQAPGQESMPLLQGKESILLVDDEAFILSSLQRVLKSSGYQVTALNDGQEAFKVFDENPYEFDLVITDLTMPDMTGLELAAKLQNVRPGIPIVLCTGYNDVISQEEARSFGIKDLLLKPVGAGELKKVIHRALEH